MFDQLSLLVAGVSIILAGASLGWQIYSSRKDDQHQDDQSLAQNRQAVALESQAEALDRQANALETTAKLAGERMTIPNEPRPAEDETAIQRWTRSYVNERLTTTLSLISTEIQKEIAPVMASVEHLGGEARWPSVATRVYGAPGQSV